MEMKTVSGEYLRLHYALPGRPEDPKQLFFWTPLPLPNSLEYSSTAEEKIVIVFHHVNYVCSVVNLIIDEKKEQFKPKELMDRNIVKSPLAGTIAICSGTSPWCESLFFTGEEAILDAPNKKMSYHVNFTQKPFISFLQREGM